MYNRFDVVTHIPMADYGFARSGEDIDIAPASYEDFANIYKKYFPDEDAFPNFTPIEGSIILGSPATPEVFIDALFQAIIKDNSSGKPTEGDKEIYYADFTSREAYAETVQSRLLYFFELFFSNKTAVIEALKEMVGNDPTNFVSRAIVKWSGIYNMAGNVWEIVYANVSGYTTTGGSFTGYHDA